MIANVSAHRRANAFAKALEALEALESNHQAPQDETPHQQPGSSSAESAERRRLLALASGLGELPAPTLDPEVRSTQRAQLLAAMEAAFAEGATRVPEQRRRTGGAHRAKPPVARLRPRSRWSKGLAAGGLTVGVAAGAFGGVAAASSDALPGDTLYGFKRGMEDLKLEMADGDADRGRIYLDQASTRLSEARRLMERTRTGDLDHDSLREIRRTLAGMRHDASEGHRLLHQVYERDGSLGPIQRLSSFSQAHRDGWSRLRERLPVQLMDVGDEVSSVFDAIDQEVGPLRALLPTLKRERQGQVGHEQTGHASQRSGAAEPGGGPASASATPSGSHTGEAATHPHPSASAGPQDQVGGLVGGAGDLLDPPVGGASPSPSTGKGDPSGKPSQPDITIPPLLPDLLPGLGIDGDDTR
ncbi:hypothetical protein TPA0910_48090 [Streptomyces hygroscopicus subsp. sporocinereus]|uniref:DUF5667 domain-containing protein n=1 Tax=Streptomyces hygroscopicus TaxID=1912 RepID=A0ABQ3U4Q4_STRHY|nr:DUF5667 domain-containing protein [Streptomyces hygroscopicus]GHJ30376.1 hypothetical protein TPA0910_48090 [Streptomyces hygroscopicus]